MKGWLIVRSGVSNSDKTQGRMLAISLLASVAAVGIMAPHAAQAQTGGEAATHDFNIPARTLSEALADFGRQSGMQVNVDADEIRDRASPGVSGRMSSDQALNRLLAGTGLTWRLNNGFVTLQPAPQTAQASGDTRSTVNLASPQGLCARQRFGGHNENTGYATSLRRAMGSLRVRNSPGESRFALCHR
jgi:hypothetical protein